MSDSFGSAAISSALWGSDGPAMCAYVTAGYPTLEEFPAVLDSVAKAADVVEVGVPFTDPMADGLTIQHSSRIAIDNGVTLEWIFETLGGMSLDAPHLLMGYYNPFLAFGLERLGQVMSQTQTSGLIIPDLPFEEDGQVREVLDPSGLAIVQLVTPSTTKDRLQKLARVGAGFVYAVTTTGVTGGEVDLPAETLEYLDRVRAASTLPVLAGFGVRQADQVVALANHVDGVVVGSALIEAIDRGEDPGEFLKALRPSGVSA